MTERTYKKDVAIIADNFHRELTSIINQHNELCVDDEQQYHLEKNSLVNFSDLLFSNLIPIYNFHIQFLRQLEQRISIW